AHRDETGRVSHSVSIAHTDRSVPFVDSFLSVHLQCCDGDRPHEGGLPREVRGIDLPTGVGLVPLTRPGRRLRPPPGDTLLHSLALAHFQGLFEVSRLRDVLSHLVWDPPEAKRGLVESLQQVSVSAQFGRFQGVAFPIQVVRVVLKDLGCTRDTWERTGLLEAFGEAMVVVLADQVPLGSKGRLELVVEPCGLVLDYPMPC
ncbi:MAG TPA: hypothetical protein PKW90_22220, partial [Myxococcota bacterium]|nr:hypothetical protein [Myxococcota bacterium]